MPPPRPASQSPAKAQTQPPAAARATRGQAAPGRAALERAAAGQAARGEAFASVEEAWFWTMASLAARAQGFARRAGDGPRLARGCDPDDVILALDRLYRQGRITPAHAVVLRKWGERQCDPRRFGGSEAECALWREALATLEAPLRRAGVLGGEI